MNREQILKDFRELLYPNNKEAESIDENQVKRIVYEGLREFLVSKNYIFTIGSYQFDITPKNLSIVYETPDTRIEISNKDIHTETTRQTPVRFFVISPEPKEKYDGEKTPYILVSGDILHYDNMVVDETYNFTLVSDNINDKITNYLQVPKDATLYEDEYLDKDKTVAINRDINVTDRRTDVGTFFNTDNVRPVEYDYQNNVYIPTEFQATEDYRKYVPDLSKKKKIISLIYSTIIDFYSEYMSK